MWRRLLAGLWRWWRADRIRAAPAEGRLLRLRPPCFLRVRGRTVEVLRRRVVRVASGLCVSYHCNADDGTCILAVAPSGEIRWVKAGRECTLRTTEVEVYERSSARIWE
jgi:hypothetical protein